MIICFMVLIWVGDNSQLCNNYGTGVEQWWKARITIKDPMNGEEIQMYFILTLWNTIKVKTNFYALVLEPDLYSCDQFLLFGYLWLLVMGRLIDCYRYDDKTKILKFCFNFTSWTKKLALFLLPRKR